MIQIKKPKSNDSGFNKKIKITYLSNLRIVLDSVAATSVD